MHRWGVAAAFTVVALGLAGCASAPAERVATPASAPPASESAPPTMAAGEPGILLIGKVVTMNDSFAVLPGARVWVRGGQIQAIVEASEALPAGAEQAKVVDSGGVIYPGLIELHNHPEAAMLPLMLIRGPYRDRYQWRYYDDTYDHRVTYPNMVLSDYYGLVQEIGRYGEYKALAGGTTTVQGAIVTEPYSQTECLVRNVETSRVGPKPVTSSVDMGRDAQEWAALRKAREDGLLVLHLAEGTGDRMADEYEYITNSGLVGPGLIIIQGVALTNEQIEDMAKKGVTLVWSPLSNFLLYATTIDIAAVKRAGVSISLGPDWSPGGSKSALGELKVADLVNKHQLSSLFTDRELVEMVTREPAQAVAWGDRAGQLKPGYVADLVVIDDRHPDVYRNLIEAIEEDVRLVAVRGEWLYGDEALMAVLRDPTEIETAVTFGGKREKKIAPNCPGTELEVMSLAETRSHLAQGLAMDGVFLLARLMENETKKETATDEEEVQYSNLKTPDDVVNGLADCPGGAPRGALTATDTERFLECKFGLPYEATKLSPLVTSEDVEWMTRLRASPNVPAYLKTLPDYYRR